MFLAETYLNSLATLPNDSVLFQHSLHSGIEKEIKT